MTSMSNRAQLALVALIRQINPEEDLADFGGRAAPLNRKELTEALTSIYLMLAGL